MKKAFAVISALLLVLSICLAGFAESGGGLDPGGVVDPENPPKPTEIDPGQEPTPPFSVPPENPSTDPSTDPSTAPSTDPPTAPSTDPPTAPPTNPPTNPPVYGFPTVTKNPTSETVREGGYAEFVARADNCTSIIWHLQNPGGGMDILVQNASTRFPGLIVDGLGTERLGLNQIPKELNEWRVRAEFVGASGNVWSEAAVISVTNQELAAPTIQAQPQNASLNSSEKTILRVTALTSEQNTTLTYQWYKNTVNSNVGGRAILGATSDTYSPDYAQGTTYYYCAVRSTNGSEVSVATKSVCAAVTYTGGAETQPTVNTAPSPAATLTPWETQQTETTQETLPPVTTTVPTRSNSLLIIVVAAIVVIAVLGILATVLILRFYGGGDEESVEIPKAVHRTPVKQEPQKKPDLPGGDDEWDDLSDLGDLSIYFDDDDLTDLDL